MKVGNLKPGMLLRAKGGYIPAVRDISSQGNQVISVIVFRPNLLNQESATFMYLGYKKESYLRRGASKHHQVLCKGRVLHMSGYDVKDVELAI